MEIPAATLTWLLEGDPAIRYQTLRDLPGALAIWHDHPADISHIQALPDPRRNQTNELSVTHLPESGEGPGVRAAIATSGWGAQLLARQDPAGTWGGGFYSPKYTSTHYTLLTLRGLGLPPNTPAAQLGMQRLLEYADFSKGGARFWKHSRHSDICVDAMVLAMAVYFGFTDDRIHGLVEHLLHHQMTDGGWNCRDWTGATHSSFHTTISVLEAFLEYGASPSAHLDPSLAARQGEEFLLEHRLYRSHRTGAVVDPVLCLFAHPPHWHYDVLRALDYFQAARCPYDPRLADPISLLKNKQTPNGCWLLEHRHNGKVFFHMERLSHPSRWNTLRALRVLNWYSPDQS